MPPIQVHIANDWTEVIAPVGAIIGVIVGSTLAQGRERRLAKGALRHACRLLYMEMLMTEVRLERIRDKRKLQPDLPALVSSWDANHEALATMSFLHWNQIHKTIVALRGLQTAGVTLKAEPFLDSLIREVVASRKILQRYVAGPLEYPRIIVWTYKRKRADQNGEGPNVE